MMNENAINRTEQFLRSLILPMLSYPSEIVIIHTDMSQSATFSVRVSRTDTGRVIGEQGAVYRGLRTLGEAYGRLLCLKVRLMPIAEPKDLSADTAQIAAMVLWSGAKLAEFARLIARQVFRDSDAIKVSSVEPGGEFGQILCVELAVSEVENPFLVKELSGALQDVIGAIGKWHGIQFVTLDVIQSAPKSEPVNVSAVMAGLRRQRKLD